MSQGIQSATDVVEMVELGHDLTGGAKFTRRVLKTVKEHRWLIALVLTYSGMMWLVFNVFHLVKVEGTSLNFLFDRSFLLMSAILIVAFLVGYCLYVMIFVRPDRLFRYLGQDLMKNWVTPERIAGAVIIYALLPTSLSTYTAVKSTIPFLNSYSWDEAFMLWDRYAHFGVDPWRILQPLLGYPWVTKIIDSIYVSWFFMMYLVLFWQAFSRRNLRLRLQFFMTYFLTWILLGNVLAVMLSSAGPVYYGRITGLSDPYQPLMTYLSDAGASYKIYALQVHDMLWNGHLEGKPSGGGISAMPSLHISIAVLMVLVTWRTHPVIGSLFAVFAVLVFIGSVHLAWHYAVDGYVSGVLTCAIWWGVGRLQQRLGGHGGDIRHSQSS